MINYSKLFLVSVVTALLLAVSASAQISRAFVAVNTGDDASPCVSSSPCRTINKAMSVVEAGGQIILTESGDYDRFVVTRSIKVAAARGVNAGVSSNGGAAVLLIGLLFTDTVSFQDLHFFGSGGQTSDGIINSFAGTLNVDNCVFTGFNNALTMSNVAGFLSVHNSTFRGNMFGVTVVGPPGEGMERATIDSCTIESNETGFLVSGKASATIRNSILSNNSRSAIRVSSSMARWAADVLVDNCQINYNAIGVLLGGTNGGYSSARLSRSTITGNFIGGVSIGANSAAFTLGNNVIAGNFPDVNGGSLIGLLTK